MSPWDRYTSEEVLQKLKVSRTTLWRRVAAGAFPRPLPNERGKWRKVDVDRFLAGESDARLSADDDLLARSAKLMEERMGRYA